MKWPHDDPVEFGRQLSGFAVVSVVYVLPFVLAVLGAAALVFL